MRALSLRISGCVVGLVMLGGCEAVSDFGRQIGEGMTASPADMPPIGQWRVGMDEMARNGAVHEQTLCETDFVPRGSQLSPMGRCRVERIVQMGRPDVPYVFVAADYRDPALSEARVASVRQVLSSMGPGGEAWVVKSILSPRWDTAGEEAVITVDGMVQALAASRASSGTASEATVGGGAAGDSGQKK